MGEVVDPEETWDGRAGEPRWTPDLPLSERITRRGRFRRVDPGRPGKVWKLRRWAAVGGWALLVAVAFAKAWRQEGGVRSPGEEV
ncbi:MAG: hypothetical protein M3O70_01500 [Actinomycetota bacterium]|nr:hypothetical protein [Actinomycetota bacterium]